MGSYIKFFFTLLKFKEKFLQFEHPQLEGNPLLAVHYSLLIIFTVTSESAVNFFFHLARDSISRQQGANFMIISTMTRNYCFSVQIPRPF